MKEISQKYDNVGGIVTMFAVPVADFIDISYNLTTGVKTARLSSSDNVIALPCVLGKTSFKEVESLGDGGKIFSVEIAGFIPNLAANRDIIRDLERGRWLVIHQDALGNLLLSGSKDNYLIFEKDRGSGVSPSSANGNNIKFAGTLSEPSTIINSFIV